MDLDIAIKYYSNLADDCRRKASPERNDYMDLKDLATEHAQLADWLNELKVLREKTQKLLEFRENYDNFWEEVKTAGRKGKETEIHHSGRVFRIREVAQ